MVPCVKLTMRSIPEDHPQVDGLRFGDHRQPEVPVLILKGLVDFGKLCLVVEMSDVY